MTTKKKGIDQSIVRDLAAILNDTDLTEIEVEQDDVRIRVSRATSAPAQYATAAIPAPAPASTPAPMSDIVSAPVAATPATNGHSVPSPMVGTAYLSPSPESDTFVKVGQTVKEGQTLLIIEAMKTMNQIPSPRSGKIVEILLEDGQPVEFGDTLVIIE
ncbi:acetyl-CoA carboxylase biotin carboxyl carrier protein [Lentilitoribacter sp. EG35]|uniref:acetyl-CoA carboxylase biotin carboxyl carrier protein n=1 Tax=Lentilitoribacter sp. EG35 TaxID=3234192 RepID=UPI0034601EED